MKDSRPIWILSGLYTLSVIATFIIPRWAVRGQDGLAAAGIGGITVMFFFLLALVLALASLVLALRRRRRIGIGAFWIGVLPTPITLGGLILLAVLMGQADQADDPAKPQPRVTQPPATAGP
ncbi:hypothetical protein H8E52_03010 [bacterium]|nr:hypothetical protein [bacterium]